MLLGAGCHGHASGREKEESSPFNEIAVVGRAIVFFSLLYYFSDFLFEDDMNVFFCRCCSASPRITNTVYMCTHVYFCTNPGKVLDFKVHEGKIWHKYPHVIHLSLCVTTIYCLNYFADGLR